MKLKEQRDIWGQSCSRSHSPFVSNQKLGPRGSDQRHRQLSPGEPDSLYKHRWSFACHCQLGLILETKNPAGSGGKESACNAGDPNSIPRIQQWHKTWSLQEMVFIYLFLAVLGLCCCAGISLVAESGSYSPVAVHGLLMVVASLVAEHRLQGSEGIENLNPQGPEDLLEEEMTTHSSILAGESHGQRGLAGYSPWSCKELDTTAETQYTHSPSKRFRDEDFEVQKG